MWTVEYILSQVSVIVALALLIGSYFLKNRVWILVFSLGNSIFYSLEFLLLGAYTGAALNLIAIARGVWFYLLQKHEKHYDWISISTLSVLMIVSGILTFEAWYSILPIIGTLTYTFSVWQKDVKLYRWLSLPVGICGVIYNIMCKSIFGVASEAVLFLFGLLSIVVYYTQKNKTEKNIEKNEKEITV